MSVATLYNKSYTSPTQITDELHTSTGASAYVLGTKGKRYFKGSTDFVVRTASGGGGTLLVEDTDYTLTSNSTLSTQAGYTVYESVTITNATYQTGNLYFTYKVVASLIDADTVNDIITDITTLQGLDHTTIYADVATAEAATGSDNDLCYVVANETFYRYESSGSTYTDDNTYVLSTGDAGDTRWLAVGGKYNIKYKDSDYNTYDGYGALDSVTGGSGKFNTTYGYNAGTAITVGDFNHLFGYYAGSSIVDGASIIAIGGSAASANVSGRYNIAIGSSAIVNALGSYNTAIGGLVGNTLTTGSDVTLIGYLADVFSNDDTDSVIIGANVSGTADQQIRIGNSNITTCFIEGIYGVTDSSSPYVRIDSNGQLFQDDNPIIGEVITYADVATAEAATGSDNDLCYVASNETFYRYEASGSTYTDDDTYVLSTGDAGDTRWLAIAGNYKIKYKNSDSNTYDGYGALDSVTGGSGQYNTAYGYNAGTAVTIGDYSCFVGYNAGYSNVSGRGVVALGYQAMYSSSTTNYGIAIGYNAGYSNTATQNIFIGYQSGYYNVASQNNVIIGASAGIFSTGAGNTVVGSEALYGASGVTDATQSSILGYKAGYRLEGGDYNNLIGAYAGFFLSSGGSNTFIGVNTGYTLSSGGNNIGIGNSSLLSLQTGTENVSVGNAAGYELTGAASYNTIIGYQSLRYGTSSNYCTALGHKALFGNVAGATGNYNVSVGKSSLESVTSAFNNVCIGSFAGDTLTTGSAVTIIGHNSDSFSNDDTDSVIIGASVTGTADQQIRIGNANVTTTFISGIYGVTDSSSPYVRIDSNGQLFQDDNPPVSGLTTYADVATAEAASGSDNDLCYVVANETIYRYESTGSAYTDDNTYVLSTGDAGDTRWLAVAGKYKIKYKNSDFNTYDGYGALDSVTGGSGQYNTAYGYDAGTSITTGDEGTFIGYRAGYSNETAAGVDYIGYEAGYFQTGGYNCGIGYQALYGVSAILSIGTYNTAIGSRAAWVLEGGSNNTSVGRNVHYNLKDGDSNSAIGLNAAYSLTDGTGTVAIGQDALYSGTTCNYVTAIGFQALYNTTTDNNSVGIGSYAGYYSNGVSNVYIGQYSGNGNVSGTTGDYNTGVGDSSLYSITSAGYLTAIGRRAFYSMTVASGAVAIGASAGYYATGYNNVFVGYETGYGTSGSASGGRNTAIGHQALYVYTNAQYNFAGGYRSGNALTSGDNNVFVGYQSGDTLTTGSNVTIVGYDADSFSNDDTDSVIIGASVVGTADQQIRIGNANVTTTFISGIYGVTDGTDPYVRISSSGQLRQDSSSIRDKENITDLKIKSNSIYKLKPKMYNRIGNEKKEMGYIAEDVLEILPEVVGLVEEKRVVKDSESDTLVPSHINYEKMIIPLVEEIKKLNKRIKKLEMR